MLFVNRLVHTLVPGGEDEPVDASCRTNAGFAASLICIGLNITLCLAKGIAGLLAGSVSLIADAFNNLSDASSNIVSLLGFRLASRPADEGHPYGHGRYEYLAGLFVAVLVCAVGINLILESVTKIIKPSPTVYSALSMAALVLSMLVKFWMAAFNRTLGNRIDSETLIATAQDSKNDVIATAAVLACSVIAHLTGLALDAWVGLAVGAYIGWSGFELIRDTVSPLLGQAPDPALHETSGFRLSAVVDEAFDGGRKRGGRHGHHQVSAGIVHDLFLKINRHDRVARNVPRSPRKGRPRAHWKRLVGSIPRRGLRRRRTERFP